MSHRRAETIADGTYPFSRSLYIYVNNANAEENPAVASFVDLYLSEEGLAKVTEAGYVSLPDDRLEATRAAWGELNHPSYRWSAASTAGGRPPVLLHC